MKDAMIVDVQYDMAVYNDTNHSYTSFEKAISNILEESPGMSWQEAEDEFYHRAEEAAVATFGTELEEIDTEQPTKGAIMLMLATCFLLGSGLGVIIFFILASWLLGV